MDLLVRIWLGQGLGRDSRDVLHGRGGHVLQLSGGGEGVRLLQLQNRVRAEAVQHSEQRIRVAVYSNVYGIGEDR